MLEERLSKAYSQQNLGGYNIPAPRQPMGPYPSLPSQAAPSAQGGVEHYYNPQHRASYHAPPGPQPYQQQQLPPPPPFASWEPAPGSAPGQYAPQSQLHRTDSWQHRASVTPQDPYQQPNQAQPQPPQQQQQPSREPVQTPQQPTATPSQDPQASFYFGAQQPGQPPSGPGPEPTTQSPYPDLQQSSQYHRGSISSRSQATPTQTPVQPAQPQPSQPSQPIRTSAPRPQSQQPPQQAPAQPQAQPPQHQYQQQPYWQQAPLQQQEQQQEQQEQQQPPPQAPQNWAYAGYTQSSFPDVPQHEPMKKNAPEEALIEL